jgi:heavy metal translocating P-type ATPase
VTRLKRFWAHYEEVLHTPEAALVVISGLLILASWLIQLTSVGPTWLSPVVALIAAVLAGWPILGLAWEGVKEKQINADQLVIIALVASVITREYIAAAIVAFIMILGGLLEELTAHSMRRSIRNLLELAPATVTRRCDGREETVAISELETGDLVLVRSGERIAVDGIIRQGEASVNQAPITGESVPVDKGTGEEVFAGTLLELGALEVETTKVGSDTLLGHIVELVEAAEKRAAPIQRVVDRYASYFTPITILIAALAWLISGDFMRAVTVVVVACPCGLVLATPTAVVAGLANGARRGILIKGGAFLEMLGKADIVGLDKTGTLTRGQPKVAGVQSLCCHSEEEILTLAGGAERYSEHPLGRAVVDEGSRRGLEIPEPATFQPAMGRGVSATWMDTEVKVGRTDWLAAEEVALMEPVQAAVAEHEAHGHTPLLVVHNGHPAGVICVADEIREESVEAMARLKALGLKVTILTGDNPLVAAEIARRTGVDDVQASLLPEDKATIVRRWVAEGEKVVMVGDGINDAPALAEATVGIAMGAAGADVAIEAADIALMNDDLNTVADVISLSRRVMDTVRSNILLFSLAFNIIGIALSAMGIIHPVGAAVMHNAGSVAVVLNSARLVFRKRL